MFEIDFAGFVELEGGKPPHRLALEPITNVFDEFRGYVEGRKRPSYCAVTLVHQNNPRGVMLTVADDGPGFLEERDVWTLFGSTPKRGAVGVAGRFNLGDKQLIAVARWARVRTNAVTVEFSNGKREVTKHRSEQVPGTIVEALMAWSLKDLEEVREQLLGVLPPAGLSYTVDGKGVERLPPKCTVQVKLPTVKLCNQVLTRTDLPTSVVVLRTRTPTLFELGMPVCDLGEVGFPWSLDVQQKVPVPPSRDTVSPAYMFRAIGSVLEQSSMDGITLLTEEEHGAPFIKGALDWVRNTDALRATVESVYGKEAVRPSNDSVANAKAAAAGATFVSGRSLSAETRRRMDEGGILPTAKQRFGGAETLTRAETVKRCPQCGMILS